MNGSVTLQARDYTWPSPEPLIAPTEAERPYPIDALPPLIGDAVRAYQTYGQQPVSLVASSALASAALAAQGLANVARDHNLVGPISLNIAIVAGSGERKTSADRRMTRAAKHWQHTQRELLQPDVDASRAKVAAHEAEREGLLAKIKSGAGKKAKSDEADIAALKIQLADIEAHAPTESIVPSLFYEDVTPEALGQNSATGWPSSSLWSDESGLVIGSHGMSDESTMRFLGLLNRFWDGADFERHRTTAKSFTIRGRRLSCSLMMQEIVLAKLLSAGGGASRGMGFLARFLFAWPQSTMGGRLYRVGDMESPELAAYDRRITHLLDHKLPTEGQDMALVPPVIPLDDAARSIWIAFHDDVEKQLGRLGEFRDVPDFAAKCAENAARIAGVFHVFENGPAGVIDEKMMTAGARLASWHLFEARRIMSAVETPTPIVNARLLLDWLLAQQNDMVQPRDILRLGPAPLRQKRNRDDALAVLRETKNVIEFTDADQKVIRLNPSLRVPV